MSDPHAPDERGFTLIELVITTGVLGVVLLTLFSALAAFTARTEQTQERALMLSEARSAVEIITRDIRAANPINTQSPVSAYDTSVSFSVYCASAGAGTCGSNNLRPVTYSVVTGNKLQRTQGPTGSTVTKVLLGPRGSTAVPITSRQGAIVNSSSQPVFTYYKKDGTRILTDGSKPTETFRDCAQYVEIHLVVVSEPGKPNSTVNLRTRADLRNFNQVSGCT